MLTAVDGAPCCRCRVRTMTLLLVSLSQALLEETYDSTEATLVDMHPSVAANRLLEDHPLQLSQCFDVFGRNEVMDDHFCSKCSRQANGDITLRRMVGAVVANRTSVASMSRGGCCLLLVCVAVRRRRWICIAPRRSLSSS